MPIQSHFPLSHSNQYSADSACGHCEGVVRHEPWCVTQNAGVQYAYGRHTDSSRGAALLLRIRVRLLVGPHRAERELGFSRCGTTE